MAYETYWKEFKEKANLGDEQKSLFEETIEKIFEDVYKKIRICPKLVAFMEAHKNIPKLVRQIQRDKGKKESFLTVLSYITSLPEGAVVVTRKVLKDLNWNMTYGDFLLRCLEFLTCKGLLRKVRFAKGKPGHKYVKSIGHECPFASITKDAFGLPISFQCLFNWDEARIIQGRHEVE